MFITFAPCIHAQSIASAMSLSAVRPVIGSVGKKWSFTNTLIGIIRQFQATPATPRLLFDSAAAIPAQQVPCPTSSLGVFVGGALVRAGVMATISRLSAIGTYLAAKSS